MTNAPGDSSAPAEETADTKSAPATPDTQVVVAGKLKIQPISNLEDFKPAAKEEPDEKESTDDTSDESDDTYGNTEPNAHDKLKDASHDEQDVVDSKAAERQANFDKIVNAKTYFLPINQVVRRRSKHVAIAGIVLIVLLGIAWADISLDAGLISIPGIEAPTHFFK